MVEERKKSIRNVTIIIFEATLLMHFKLFYKQQQKSHKNMPNLILTLKRRIYYDVNLTCSLDN